MTVSRYLLLLVSLLLTANVSANNQVTSLLDRSYQQSRDGNLDQALLTVQQAAKLEPGSSLVHTRLGGVRILRQEYSDGIRDFQQAIMLDQKNASAFVGLAVSYLHLGKYSLARAALQEAGNIDPSKQPEIDRLQDWIKQRTVSSTHQ